VSNRETKPAEMLTIQEVAAKLRVSVRTVRRMVERQELAARKVGRQWRFPVKNVTDYMAQIAGPK